MCKMFINNMRRVYIRIGHSLHRIVIAIVGVCKEILQKFCIWQIVLFISERCDSFPQSLHCQSVAQVECSSEELCFELKVE